MKLCFFGSPLVSARILSDLIDFGVNFEIGITMPPKRRNRGSALVPTEVEKVLSANSIKVSYDPKSVIGVADFGLVVAYGRLIKNDVLDAVDLVNVHFSLLPRWRGAAPVERAILSGDSVTGVTLMKVVPELDAGPTYDRFETTILPFESSASLTLRLGELASQFLISKLNNGSKDNKVFDISKFKSPIPQTGEITYADKIDKSLRRVNFLEPVTSIERIVRIGGAWCMLGEKRLQIEDAQAVEDTSNDFEIGQVIVLESEVFVKGIDGLLKINLVKPEGKNTMTAKAFVAGFGGKNAKGLPILK